MIATIDSVKLPVEEKILPAFNAAIASDPRVIELRAGNPSAKIDYYDFQCHDCYLAKVGRCSPRFKYAGHTSCQGIVESISVSCEFCQSVRWSKTGYCHRPKTTQCQRKHAENRCQSCQYFNNKWHHLQTRAASYWYEPSIAERIAHERFWIKQFADSRDNPRDAGMSAEYRKTSSYWQEAIDTREETIRILESISSLS